tara:strand:- start:2368 stop:2592 length:225 start_codon:yes stop_codon:yes gene_type:complete
MIVFDNKLQLQHLKSVINNQEACMKDLITVINQQEKCIKELTELVEISKKLNQNNEIQNIIIDHELDLTEIMIE